MNVHLLRKLTYIIAALFMHLSIRGQSAGDSILIADAATIPNSLSLDGIYDIAFSNYFISEPASIAALPYQKPDPEFSRKGMRTDTMNAGYAFLRFTISNPTDSAQKFYFYPGYYMKALHLFRKAAAEQINQATAVPDIMPNVPDKIAYRAITLAPHESSTFYAQIQPAEISTNHLLPTLINPDFVNTHVALMHYDNYDLNILTYFLVGIMLMMVIYSFSNYIFSLKKEFLYYSVYALCISVLLFVKAYQYKSSNYFNFFFEEYLDFVVMLTGIAFYIAFVRNFLSTQVKYPKLDKVLKWNERLLLFFLLVYSLLYFTSNNVVLLGVLENCIKYFMLAIGIFFVAFGFRLNDRLMNYLVWGNLALVALGLTSLSLIVSNVVMKNIFTAAIFYYDLGIVLELIFFLFGLTYKNRLELIEKIKIEEAFKLEDEKRDFEKQLAVIQAQQEERNRISADMHDELGGGMTAIRLMSELAKQRLKQFNIPEIEKISASANDLLGKMNAIIWSMSPSNDTMANLVAYIRSYALEFFENTSIICHVQLPEEIPQMEINGVKRRSIFLVIKETLNNVVKHSKATQVFIVITLDNGLLIRIHDNGIGFDLEKVSQFGNGLRNMRKRMNSIDGRFYIEKNNGTLTTMEVSL